METLPVFPTFDFEADKTTAGPRWEKWCSRLENLLDGMNIDNDKRKRALLLHYAGERVYDIYDAEKKNTEATFEATKKVLDDYFSPKVNEQMEIYKFRQYKQKDDQTLDEFVTELRKLAKYCKFADTDKEILSQLIQSCKSNRLRRRALREADKTLDEILVLGRSLELADSQASAMEKPETVNVLFKKSRPKKPHTFKPHHTSSNSDNKHMKQKPGKSITCRNCGGEFPHKGQCPAKGQRCNHCSKMNHFKKVCRKRLATVNEIQYGSRDDSSFRDGARKGASAAACASSSEDDSDYAYTVQTDQFVGAIGKKTPKITVKLNKVKCTLLLDSGASVNILDEQTYKSIGSPKLQKNNNPPLYPYGGGKALNIKGRCQLMVETANKIDLHTFYVVKGNHGALIGYPAASELELIKIVNKIEKPQDKYPNLFKGVGKLKDTKVKIHIDPTVKPVAQRHVRTPFHLREKVGQEIQKLLDEDIIEKVEGEPTPWISPIVAIPKKNPNEIRVCVDMREANRAIVRERHMLPTVEELIHDLNGAAVFSKLDLRSGYHQLELEDSSKYITCFSTHMGIFRYKRLNFGISSASEIFQETVRNQIQDIENVRNISDDILVYGKTQEEHDIALNRTFKRLNDRGLTLNKQKCELNKNRITFFGVVFSDKGVSPDPAKVNAIKDASTPQNEKELRSFLGMTSYCSRFIPDYATICEPLRRLTHQDEEWKWTEEQQNSFDALKSKLSSETVMAYYDPKKDIEVIVDASPVGLAAILVQNKIVAYASRALTDVESRYSQTEREALAIVWACEHYDIYLRGAKSFKVITDHKPLEKIWEKPKPTLRIERWGLRLQPYKLKIQYRRGEDNPADYMSRHPISSKTVKTVESKVAEEYVNFIKDEAVMKAMNMDEVKMETSKDHTLQKAISYVRSGAWHHMKTLNDSNIDMEELSAMRSIKDELTIHSDNVLLRDKRIVLPRSLRDRAIHIAHEGHQGITRTKSFLRSKAWFPNLSDRVEQLIKGCIACQTLSPGPNMEPYKMSDLPSGPWRDLSADFCGPLPSGDYLFVITDEYSRYPIVEIVRSVSANTVIPVLDKVLSEFGYPQTIKTDNGSPFNSYQFEQYAKHSGFRHRKITPRWPRANSQAESFNKPLMKVIRAAHVTKSNWKQEMYQFLRQYRSTPHASTGFTPYRLMFQREPKTKMPQINEPNGEKKIEELVIQNDEKAKSKAKNYGDMKNNAKESDIQIGDTVLVKNDFKEDKLSTKFKENPHVVTKKKGPMVTASSDNGEITRNSTSFKKIDPRESISIPVQEEEDDEPDIGTENNKDNNSVHSSAQHRPVRVRKEPSKFKDYVRY